jgi:hypothetical protein
LHECFALISYAATPRKNASPTKKSGGDFMALEITLPKRQDYQVIPWDNVKHLKNLAAAPTFPAEICVPFSVGAAGVATKLVFPALVTALALTQPHLALAVGLKGIMVNAFNPIVDLVQGAAYPLALVSISTGMLLITMGNRHKGMEFIKWGALGFIGMQFVPGIMQILMQAGSAVSAP